MGVDRSWGPPPFGGSPSPIGVSPNGGSPIGGSPSGGSPNGGGPVLPCFAPPVLSISRVEAGQGLLFAGRDSLLF